MDHFKSKFTETNPNNLETIPLPKTIGESGIVKNKNIAKAKNKIISNLFNLILFQKSIFEKFDIKIIKKYIPIEEIKVFEPNLYLVTLP
jgi:hypothetical protein